MLICRPTADHFIESGQALRLHDEGEITWKSPAPNLVDPWSISAASRFTPAIAVVVVIG